MFKCSVYEIGEQVVTNLSTLLEKYLTIENLHRVDFLRIFTKYCIFEIFRDFFNSPVSHAKMD